MSKTTASPLTIRCRFAVLGFTAFAVFFVSSYTGSTSAFIAATLSALCSLLSVILKKQNALFVFTAVTASFLFFGIYSRVYIEPISRLYGNTYPVTASVISVNDPDNDTVRVTAEGYGDGTKVRFAFYSSDIGLKRGDTITADVKFSAPAAAASYSENYDYSRGMFARVYVSGVRLYAEHSGFEVITLINAYSLMLRETVKEYLTGDEGALLLAMFFGDKSGMSPLLSRAVRKSGLSHMTAVSGMHMSLIITVFAGRLDMCGLKRRYKLKFCVIAGVAAVFAVFFGMTASVRRSALMMIVYYGSLMFGRRNTPINSLGAALLVILLAEPCACRDAGLILSACGTFGAGTVSPALCEYLRRYFRVGEKAESVISGICATYCTIPVTMLIFGGFSLFSAITTVVVYPMFYAAMVCTLVFALSGGLFGAVVLLPAGIAMKMIIFIMKLAAGLRFGYITVDTDIMLPFTAVSAAFVIGCHILSKRSGTGLHFTVISGVICLCALATVFTVQKAAMSGITRITVYSDGKNGLMAIENGSGVSAFASGVTSKISAAAYDTLTECYAERFLLLSVTAEEKRGAVYSDVFASLGAIEKHYLDNTEGAFDVNGDYTVYIYEDAMETQINGVSILFTDAACAETYGAHNIAVYSGYKKSADTDINGITVFCDKRYSDSPYNAYYKKTEILIDEDGRYLIKMR